MGRLRKFSRLVMAVTAVLIVGPLLLWACPVAAEPDLAKALVGKWAGGVRGSFNGNRERVLVIDSVTNGAAEGRFGFSEDRLGKIQIAITGDPARPRLEFTTTGANVLVPWKLTLEFDKVLSGTVYLPVRGGSGRLEYPGRFEKAE